MDPIPEKEAGARVSGIALWKVEDGVVALLLILLLLVYEDGIARRGALGSRGVRDVFGNVVVWGGGVPIPIPVPVLVWPRGGWSGTAARVRREEAWFWCAALGTWVVTVPGLMGVGEGSG